MVLQPERIKTQAGTVARVGRESRYRAAIARPGAQLRPWRPQAWLARVADLPKEHLAIPATKTPTGAHTERQQQHTDERTFLLQRTSADQKYAVF